MNRRSLLGWFLSAPLAAMLPIQPRAAIIGLDAGGLDDRFAISVCEEIQPLLPGNAAAIGAAVRSSMIQVIDERLNYHLRGSPTS